MNATIRLAVLSLSILGPSGCASMHDAMATAPPPAMGHAPMEPDYVYMARIEREAHRMGTAVQWINPPMKRVPDHD